MAGLAAKDVPRLELKWAFGFPGAVRSIAQPTIIGGRAFIGSQGGKVYSLDASSGCTYWEYDAGKPVRSAVVVGPSAGGWAAYFRFGNSAARFEKIRSYSRMRMALFISKRKRRSREFGWSVVAYQSPDQLGLITLSGIVAEPRPFRAWRERPNAGGERRR